MNKYYLIFLLITINTFFSCSIGNYYGDEQLGGGYILWKDGRIQSINYVSENTRQQGISYVVISENVIEVKFNDSIVIAKTSYKDSYQFWIIDKRLKINTDSCTNQHKCDSILHSNVLGPMDLTTFKNALFKINTNLIF